MGKRGPRPTPTAILKIHGSKRAKRRADEVQAPTGAPIKPAQLKGRASEIWDQLIPLLEEMGVLSRIDPFRLRRYCIDYAQWELAAADIEKNGSTYTLCDEHGQPRCEQQRAIVGVLNAIAQRLAKDEAEFGMTPASRVGLKKETSDGTHAQNFKSRFFPKRLA